MKRKLNFNVLEEEKSESSIDEACETRESKERKKKVRDQNKNKSGSKPISVSSERVRYKYIRKQPCRRAGGKS